jgi:hypothetical protein
MPWLHLAPTGISKTPTMTEKISNRRDKIADVSESKTLPDKRLDADG